MPPKHPGQTPKGEGLAKQSRLKIFLLDMANPRGICPQRWA
jgi:hypothetical protein